MINVLVTAVGGRSVGFHVMRSLLLEPDKFNVIVTDMNSNAAGLYYGPKGYVIPPCTHESYLNELNALIYLRKIDIVIPGCEPELYFLSDNRDKVNTKLLINPKETIDICRDKSKLYNWLKYNDYYTPLSYTWDELRDLDIKSVNYPLLSKPTKKTGGSRGVQILANHNELFDYINKFGIDDTIFQEYVSTPYDEYTVGVVVYNDEVTVDSIVMHRILDDISLQEKRIIDGKEYAISTGLSQVITNKFGWMRSFCEYLAKDIGIIGPANIQLRVEYDHFSGPIFWVFEVHPRFSGTSYMRATVGFNDSARLVENFVEGKIPERMNYKINATLLKYLDHVVVNA